MKTFLSVAFLAFSLIISSSLWGMEVKEENRDKNRSSRTTTAEWTDQNRDQAAQDGANNGPSNPRNGSPTVVSTSRNQNMSSTIPDEKLGTSYSSTGARTPEDSSSREPEGDFGERSITPSHEGPSENTPRFRQSHWSFSSLREQELPQIEGVDPELVSSSINAQSDEERMPIFSTMVNNISSLNGSQMSYQDQDALLERPNQIKEGHDVENVTSDRRVKAAGGGGVIQESGKEIGKLTKKEEAPAGVNIINRLAEKQSAQLRAEFLGKDLEEKKHPIKKIMIML